MSNFFQQASARWTADMPKFFKRISNTGKGFAATGTALLASGAIPNVHLPTVVVHIGTIMITAGAIASVVSNLTVNDTSAIPPDTSVKK